MNCIAFVVEKEIAEKFINDNELNNTLTKMFIPNDIFLASMQSFV